MAFDDLRELDCITVNKAAFFAWVGMHIKVQEYFYKITKNPIL